MIDFKVDDKALQTVSSVVINANFEETKSALQEMMKPYEGLVVSENNLPSAKSDRAKINRVAKTIDEYRKTVKKIYTTPYDEFKKKCDELTAICNNAASNIDKQIKNYEAKQKEAKISELRNKFKELSASISNYITFEEIYNKRWENTTFAMNEAVEEISKKVDAVKKDIEAIKTMHSEFEPSLLDLYARTHDVALCISKHSEYSAIKKAEEERKAKIEEAKRLAYQKQEQEVTETIVPDSSVVEEHTVDISEAVKLYTLRFEVTGTKEQLVALSKFMKSNNIAFVKA